jgi:hypothetical protein
MNVTCPKCSKQLKVKDEWAGRTLKCPACTNTFKATATPAPVAGKPSQPPAKLKKEATKPGIAINGGAIALWGGLALIPIIVLLVIFGPIRVKKHWDANQQKVEGDVTDVIDFALRCEASTSGTWNPRKSGQSPTVVEMRCLPDIFRLSPAQTVKFDGITSNGKFEGTYNFETGEVDATLKLGGITLPSGIHADEEGVVLPGGQRVSGGSPIPGKKTGGSLESIHVTGRVTSGGPTAELDGKKAQIYFPPAVDDDGNVIEDTNPKPAGT